MKSDTPLDYALFQLSPKRSRCELFISRDGNSEKLASGLVKPFVTHLKIAEEHVALSNQSIKLEVEQRKNGEMWFTKGTLERFVRFVSTPEVLEMVNTFDAEMSQLEAARVIYSQGVEDKPSSILGGGGTSTTAAAAADATKKELLRAIDVRLAAVKQDLTTACTRAAAAGFNPGAVSELQMFADQFGAYRLNEACSKFICVCERRPDLINPWKSGVDDRTVRSSYGSDMSIDDDPSTEQSSRPHQPHIFSAGQQSTSSSVTFPLRRTSRESIIEKEGSSSRENKEEGSSGGSEAQPPATQPGAPARRLSVQDRISLFENKQKETSSGSGGKPIVAKSAEHRRLSSDVSSGSAAAEKAVLRRWSGVSDMSISLDLSGEKKDGDSPLCTPSVSSASQAKSDNPKRLNTTSDKPEFRSIPGISGDSWSKDQVDSSIGEEMGITKPGENFGTVSSGRSGDAYEPSIIGTVGTQAKTQSSLSLTLTGVKNQATSQSHYRSSVDRADRFGFKDQGRSKGSSGNDEQSGTIEQVSSETHIARLKEGGGPQMKPGAFSSKSGDVKSVKESYQPPEGEDFEPRNQSVPQPQLMAPLKAAVDSGSKIREAFAAQYKGPEGMLLGSQSSWKSLREIEEVDLASFQKQSDSSITKVEDSGIPRMKVQKQISVHEHIRKPQSRKNYSNSVYGNNSVLFSQKMVTKDEEDFATTPVTLAEQVQRIRQSKGNQELNDELKMKANELEKLFAEHKLRAPGDQSNSARRSKPTDVQIEQASSLLDRKQVTGITPQFLDNNTVIDTLGSSSNVVKLTDGSVVKLVESQDYGDTLRCNVSDLGLSDDSRGKFYDTYMQKRDAKLREEWGSRRTEKEAKLKDMQDSFERSRTEMRAKFSGSADRQDPIYSVRQRAERLRSFNTRSTLKMEQPLDFLQSEDDGEAFELLEQKPFGQDTSFSDVSLGNGVSRSSQTKRLLPNRNLSSSTSRNSVAPVPRSATKVSNSGSVRRRMQSDYLHMHSVPNFSELRKENTKPYSASSKIVRPQLRNYTRSRSASDEIPHVKEEKARRSQSLRKSTVSPAEFKDMSSLNSEGVVLTPLKFDIEQAEQGRDKFSKCMESKPFFQKNNSIGRGAGAGDVKLKASMVSESFSNDEESDELTFDPEDSADIGKDEDEEESLTRTSEDHVNMDHREPSLSQESAKLINSGSENGDALQSFSQDPSLLLSSMPSTFLPVGSVLDSPGESPMSWNSRIHHPFTYHHEVSDIDVSADSPIGSPASWNLHSLNQTESDAARMRKKWGSAQKPVIGANSSNNQSRKDTTKGFKRLLKFGRKSRGTESLVDWISATTSDGDDDTEDGRDPANRSSDDLRKSRMGFSQGHASEDSFNESEYFSEQVQGLNSSIPAPPANFKLREDHLSGSSMKGPRSFFSLSSFRSKGSESKLR